MNSRTLPIIALLLAIVVFFGYTNSTWKGEVAEAKANIASYNKALEAAKQYQASITSLEQQKAALDQGQLARLENLLPDSVDNVSMILALNALATRSGLSLSSINVAQQSKGALADAGNAGSQGTTSSVDLTVSAKGTYSALKAFLMGIEKSERLLDVTDLTVEGSDTGVYSYNMTIRLYWLH